MVLASKPVASVMRLAARPVGAHSRRLVPFAARMRKVVLPTPGPPVMTRTLDISASRIAEAGTGEPKSLEAHRSDWDDLAARPPAATGFAISVRVCQAGAGQFSSAPKSDR